MKKFTLASFTLAAFIGSFSISANAEDCTWIPSGLSINNQTFTNTFTCQANGVLATKTVTVQAKVAPSCSLTINNNQYANYGNCATPDIRFVGSDPAPGTKVCEFNDPRTGTTPGCTQRGIAGSGNTVAYEIAKDGKALLVVSKTNQSNWCTLSGENANYRSEGDCNNFRIYKK